MTSSAPSPSLKARPPPPPRRRVPPFFPILGRRRPSSASTLNAHSRCPHPSLSPAPAGVPAPQQVLMFAGQELQDDLLLERDYKLDSYSLADKVRRWW